MASHHLVRLSCKGMRSRELDGGGFCRRCEPGARLCRGGNATDPAYRWDAGANSCQEGRAVTRRISAKKHRRAFRIGRMSPNDTDRAWPHPGRRGGAR
jgi:hypothetical protein